MGADRQTDDRQGGVGSQSAGQMGGLSGGGDDDSDAVLPGVPGKGQGFGRGAVGGVDVDLGRDAEGFQRVNGLLHHFHVTVASHDNSDFIHCSLPNNKKVS